MKLYTWPLLLLLAASPISVENGKESIPGYIFNQNQNPLKIHFRVESKQPIHTIQWKLGNQSGSIHEFEIENNTYHAMITTDTNYQWKEKLWYQIDDQEPQITETYFIYDTIKPEALITYKQPYKKEDILYFSQPVEGTIHIEEENFFETVQVLWNGKQVENPIQWQDQTGSFHFDQSGRYEICYKDYSNNEMKAENAIFDIELTPPKIWLENNILYVQDRNFDAKRLSDPQVQKAEWKQEKQIHFLDLETIYPQGIHPIQLKYQNPSGQETKIEETLCIDHEPPHSLQIKKTKPNTIQHNKQYYKEGVDLSFFAQDEISQIDYFTWQWNDQSGKVKPNETVHLSQEGRGKLKITAFDQAGNQASLEEEQEIVIDHTPPHVILQLPKAIHQQQLKGSLLVEEENFDPENVQMYMIRNGSKKPIDLYWNEKQASFQITKEGTIQIYAEYMDPSLNSANIHQFISQEYIVDSTSPQLEITPMQENKPYHNHAIEYKVKYQDENPCTIYAFINGKRQKVDSSLVLNSEGSYAVQFQAIDSCNNVSTLYTMPECSIDRTIQKPDIQLSATVIEQDFQMKIHTNEPHILEQSSEIIQIFPDGSMKPRNKTDLQKQIQENDGRYVVRAYVRDQAGNEAWNQKEFIINRFGTQYTMSDSLQAINHKKIQKLNQDLIIRWYNPSLSSTQAILYKDGRPMRNVKWQKDENQLVISHENFKEEGVYQIVVYTEDGIRKQENEKIQFYVDKTPPEILKLEGLEKKVYLQKEVKVDYEIYDAFGLQDICIFADGKLIEKVDQFADSNQAKGYFVLPGKNKKQQIQIWATDQAKNSVHQEFEVLISQDFWPILRVNPLFWMSGIAILIFGFFKFKKRRINVDF